MLTAQRFIDKVGINLLVQYASGRLATPGQFITVLDVQLALTGQAQTDVQASIANWYQVSHTHVQSVVTGYISRFSVTSEELAQSLVPGLAIDLLQYELCPNPSEELIRRRDYATARLKDIEKGVIKLTEHSTDRVPTTGLKTVRAGSRFDWGGY
jgi:hypothetical protein